MTRRNGKVRLHSCILFVFKLSRSYIKENLRLAYRRKRGQKDRSKQRQAEVPKLEEVLHDPLYPAVSTANITAPEHPASGGYLEGVWAVCVWLGTRG